MGNIHDRDLQKSYFSTGTKLTTISKLGTGWNIIMSISDRSYIAEYSWRYSMYVNCNPSWNYANLSSDLCSNSVGHTDAIYIY